jgi:plastocyanin
VEVRTRFRQAVVATSIVGAALLPTAPAPAIVPKQVVNIESGTACVNGAAFCYQPRKPTISSGVKVVWKNLTMALHTVTRCDVANCGVSGGTGSDTGLNSPFIAAGAKYRFIFHGSGSYVYYCTVHGYASMHAKIVVA